MLNWDSIKDYMNSFAGIVLLTLPFFFVPEIKKSKLYIAFFIAATFFLLWLGFDKIHRDDQTQIHSLSHSDSVINNAKDEMKKNVDSALKANNLVYNPKTKSIKIIDTLNKVVDPVMDILDDSTRVTGNLNKAGIEIDFKTINNGIAYNPRAFVVLFMHVSKDYLLINKPKLDSNFYLKSYQNNVYTYTFGVKLPDKEVTEPDTTFIYFKALYSNKQEDGIYLPALRRIYFTVISETPKSIKDVKILPVTEIQSNYAIRRWLIKHKYW